MKRLVAGVLAMLLLGNFAPAALPGGAAKKQLADTNRMFAEQWVPGVRAAKATATFATMVAQQKEMFAPRTDFLAMYEMAASAVVTPPQLLSVAEQPTKFLKGKCLVAYIVEADGSVQQ